MLNPLVLHGPIFFKWSSPSRSFNVFRKSQKRSKQPQEFTWKLLKTPCRTGISIKNAVIFGEIGIYCLDVYIYFWFIHLVTIDKLYSKKFMFSKVSNRFSHCCKNGCSIKPTSTHAKLQKFYCVFFFWNKVI